MHKHALALPTLLLSLLLADSAAASPVTYAFTGDITFAEGIWAGGTSVTGTYTLDDSLTLSLASSGIQQAVPTGNPGLDWAISVSVLGVTRTTADNANAEPGPAHHELVARDESSTDSWYYAAYRQVGPDDSAQLFVSDTHPVGAPDGLFAGSDNLGSSAILTPGDVSLYDDTTVNNYFAYDELGQFEGRIEFTLTSVTVPEPTTAMLVLVGLVVAIAGSRRTPAPE